VRFLVAQGGPHRVVTLHQGSRLKDSLATQDRGHKQLGGIEKIVCQKRGFSIFAQIITEHGDKATLSIGK